MYYDATYDGQRITIEEQKVPCSGLMVHIQGADGECERTGRGGGLQGGTRVAHTAPQPHPLIDYVTRDGGCAGCL